MTNMTPAERTAELPAGGAEFRSDEGIDDE